MLLSSARGRLHPALARVTAAFNPQRMSVLAASTKDNIVVAAENQPIMEPAAKMARIESLRVKKLSPTASIPRRGSAKAAGYDLSSSEDTVIPARGKALVKTDLQIAIPPGTYARIAPRSGLAWKNFIDTGAGVIDEDYRGEVKVLLFNHSDQDFAVKAGDRIAQMILERIATPEVEEVEELDDTDRGAGGFGSTGVAKS